MRWMCKLLPKATETATILDVDGSMKRIRYIDYYNPSCGLEGDRVPLVLLCGTAQTIESWAMHIKPLAATGRRIIIPELRCQGHLTDLSTDHVSYDRYIDDIKSFLTIVDAKCVDLAGFSFGGRIAIAFAAHAPEYVRRLSITGVPYARPKLGELVLSSWETFLKKKEYEAAAWSFIINGFSPSYINNNATLVSGMVDIIVKNNDFEKLMKLISHTNQQSLTSSVFTASHCAGLIRCHSQVIAATEDRISSYEEEKKLAAHMGNLNGISNSNGIGRSLPIVEFHTITGSGHLSPFEKPLVWRKTLCDFLNSR
jgi:pimeloyl-ACP methyl ester carboxylesterase